MDYKVQYNCEHIKKTVISMPVNTLCFFFSFLSFIDATSPNPLNQENSYKTCVARRSCGADVRQWRRLSGRAALRMAYAYASQMGRERPLAAKENRFGRNGRGVFTYIVPQFVFSRAFNLKRFSCDKVNWVVPKEQFSWVYSSVSYFCEFTF